VIHTIRVRAPDPLRPFRLPVPPVGDELRQAVRDSLELLTVAPDRVYTIRRKAEDAGFNGKLLYRARDFLKLEEYTAMEKPCWRLPLNGKDF